MIKALFQRFRASCDTMAVEAACRKILADGFNAASTKGKEAVGIVYKAFKDYNATVHENDIVYRRFEKRYIGKRITYHFQTFQRHNRHLYNFLKAQNGNYTFFYFYFEVNIM